MVILEFSAPAALTQPFALPPYEFHSPRWPASPLSMLEFNRLANTF